MVTVPASSVADPDPGSGAFLTPVSLIRDPGCVRSKKVLKMESVGPPKTP